MRKDFKKASFLFAIIVFFFGISALVISSVVNYFSYSDLIVILGEFISFVAFILLMGICIFAKSDYNYVCTKFADYILDNRKKEAEYQINEAQHLKQIQTMKSAAAHEREDAVAAALEQGRNEGAHAALQAVGSRPTPAPTDRQLSAPAPQQPQPQQPQPQPQPRQIPSYMQPIMPNDEILYNEYGEPVMIRRRVRKSREHYSGNVLYDRYGTPVARRTQNIWEIGGQKIQVANPSEPSVEPVAPQQPFPQVSPQQQVVVSPPQQQTVQPQQQQPSPQVSPQQQTVQPPPQTTVQQSQPVPQTASQPSTPTVQPPQPPTTQQSEQPLQFIRRTGNTENSEPFRYF